MSPTIRVDDEVYQALQGRAEPFSDTPNSVLRRVLGLATADEAEHYEDADAAATPSPRSTQPAEAKTRKRRSAGRSDRRKRAATGTILREDQYEIPLLEVLRDQGGSAPASEAIEELGKRLNGKLKPKDYDELKSGRIRWQNRSQFVRLRLVERGDMVSDSPRGIWEISQQGKKRLAESRRDDKAAS